MPTYGPTPVISDLEGVDVRWQPALTRRSVRHTNLARLGAVPLPAPIELGGRVGSAGDVVCGGRSCRGTRRRFDSAWVRQASAKGAAKSGARVKAEFLATMSQADTRLDESQTELLSTLRSSDESLLAVANDILDLSKINSGRLQLERLPVCLPELMAEVCTLVRSMAHRKGLTLELATRGTALTWIESDPARIRQMGFPRRRFRCRFRTSCR